MNLSVAVLTGGRSRRMGTDKALLPFEGYTLLERVLAIGHELSDDCFVVGLREEYRRFGAPVVADTYPGAGALGGIATALAAARHDFTLVVACDMPLLSGPLLRAMAAEPRDYDVLIPSLPAERSSQGAGETLETLHAIYARRCLDPIVKRLRAGQHKVIGFFGDVTVRKLDEIWLRRFDPFLLSVLNANTPEELADVARHAAASRKEEQRG